MDEICICITNKWAYLSFHVLRISHLFTLFFMISILKKPSNSATSTLSARINYDLQARKELVQYILFVE
jgi:hypothetical protein